MSEERDRDELLRMVERLMKGEGTERDQDRWLKQLGMHMPFREVIRLIFWSDEDLSAEQVLERILSYEAPPAQPLPPPTSGG